MLQHPFLHLVLFNIFISYLYVFKGVLIKFADYTEMGVDGASQYEEYKKTLRDWRNRPK